MMKDAVSIPRDARKHLSRAGTLNDPVRIATLVLMAMCAQNVGVFVFGIVRSYGREDFWIICLVQGATIVTSLLPLLAFWQVIRRDGKEGRIFFLRANHTDKSDLKLRKYLQGALGNAYVLVGIRSPQMKSRFRWLGPLHEALATAGSPLFDLTSPDHNWFARLYATLQKSKAAIIDLRSLTDNVHHEIRLVWLLLGPKRIIFIVDGTKTRSEWRALIESIAETPSKNPDELLVLRFDDKKPIHSMTFALTLHRLVCRLDTSPVAWSPTAYDYAIKVVGETSWKTPFWERSWIMGIAFHVLYSLVIGVAASAVFAQEADLRRRIIFTIILLIVHLPIHCLMAVAALRRREQQRYAQMMADASRTSGNQGFWGGIYGRLFAVFAVLSAIGVSAVIAIPNIGSINDSARRATAMRNAQSVASVLNSAIAAGIDTSRFNSRTTGQELVDAAEEGVTPRAGIFSDKTFRVPEIEDSEEPFIASFLSWDDVGKSVVYSRGSDNDRSL